MNYFFKANVECYEASRNISNTFHQKKVLILSVTLSLSSLVVTGEKHVGH